MTPGLARVWFVGLRGHANLKQLDWNLQPLLRRLEDSGVTLNVIAAGDRLAANDNADLRQLHDLGVADVSSRELQMVDGEHERSRIVMLAAGTSRPDPGGRGRVCKLGQHRPRVRPAEEQA